MICNAAGARTGALAARLLPVRAAALSTLLYVSVAVPGAAMAANPSPVNGCNTASGGVFNCSQAQAMAECKRLSDEWVVYQKSLYPNSPWFQTRAAANACSYKLSNATTGQFTVSYEYSTTSGSTWANSSIDSTFHSISATRLDPAKNIECDTCAALVGNPINLLTGAKSATATDFQAANSPLSWLRHYSSVAVISNEKQVMGKNWRHGYAHRLIIADTSTSGTVVINRPGGNQYVFTRNGAGTWVTDADVQYKLSPVLDTGVRVGWMVTAPDSSEEHYNLSGQLMAITYPSGNLISLSYTSGRLTSVQDQQGRALDLLYVGDLVDTVLLPDGKRVKYGYDAQQRLTSVGLQNNAGPTPQYDTYSYEYTNSSYPNALTGRTDETGISFATWAYDTSGRATASAHAGGTDAVTVGYPSSSSSTVTNPLGETVTHTHQVKLGRAKLTGTAKQCSGCGGGFLSRTYDAHGYPDQQLDFRNVVTDYDYDARGLIRQREDAATSGEAKRTVQTDWHPEFNVPIERRTYDSTGALVRKEAWTYNPRGQVLTYSQVDP